MKITFLLFWTILISYPTFSQWSEWKNSEIRLDGKSCLYAYSFRTDEVSSGGDKQKVYVRIKNLNAVDLNSIEFSINYPGWRNPQTRTMGPVLKNEFVGTWFAIQSTTAAGNPQVDIRKVEWPDATESPSRAVQTVAPVQEMSENIFEKSYALVIGISDYTGAWPKLPGVMSDVTEVEQALVRNGFITEKVINPNKTELDNAFESFINRNGNSKNRLLIYFAGHGHTMKTNYSNDSLGYIVPLGASNPFAEPEEFKKSAISMQRIEEYALKTDARHVLFIFDACFSGSVFTASRSALSESLKYKMSNPVRQFITSGSSNEKVPDQSVFRRLFVRALDGEADLNHDSYTTGTEMGDYLQNNVINYTRGAQHPQYGKIRNPNLDKGDFVFMKNASLNATRDGGKTSGITKPLIKKTHDALDKAGVSIDHNDDGEKIVEKPKEIQKEKPVTKSIEPTSIERGSQKGTVMDKKSDDRTQKALKDLNDDGSHTDIIAVTPTPTPKAPTPRSAEEPTNTNSQPNQNSDFQNGVKEIDNRIKNNGNDAASQRLKNSDVFIEEDGSSKADRSGDKSKQGSNANGNSSGTKPSTQNISGNGVSEIKKRIDKNETDAANARLKNAGLHWSDNDDRGIIESNTFVIIKKQGCMCHIEKNSPALIKEELHLKVFATREDALKALCADIDPSRLNASRCWEVIPADACK